MSISSAYEPVYEIFVGCSLLNIREERAYIPRFESTPKSSTTRKDAKIGYLAYAELIRKLIELGISPVF